MLNIPVFEVFLSHQFIFRNSPLYPQGWWPDQFWTRGGKKELTLDCCAPTSFLLHPISPHIADPHHTCLQARMHKHEHVHVCVRVCLSFFLYVHRHMQ